MFVDEKRFTFSSCVTDNELKYEVIFFYQTKVHQHTKYKSLGLRQKNHKHGSGSSLIVGNISSLSWFVSPRRQLEHC